MEIDDFDITIDSGDRGDMAEIEEMFPTELVAFMTVSVISVWIFLAIFVYASTHFCKSIPDRDEEEEEEADESDACDDKTLALRNTTRLTIVIGGIFISISVIWFGCGILIVGADRVLEQLMEHGLKITLLTDGEYGPQETYSAVLANAIYPSERSDLNSDADDDTSYFGRDIVESSNDGIKENLNDTSDLSACRNVLRKSLEHILQSEFPNKTSIRNLEAFSYPNKLRSVLNTDTERTLDTLSMLSEVSNVASIPYLMKSIDAYLNISMAAWAKIFDLAMEKLDKKLENSSTANGIFITYSAKCLKSEESSKLYRPPSAQFKKLKKLENFNSAYAIYPMSLMIAIVTILLSSPVLIGLLLGLSGTNFFKKHREVYYKRTLMSTYGARIIEGGFYVTSAFLWLFWAFAALIFITSSVPISDCLSLELLGSDEFSMLKSKMESLSVACEILGDDNEAIKEHKNLSSSELNHAIEMSFFDTASLLFDSSSDAIKESLKMELKSLTHVSSNFKYITREMISLNNNSMEENFQKNSTSQRVTDVTEEILLKLYSSLVPMVMNATTICDQAIVKERNKIEWLTHFLQDIRSKEKNESIYDMMMTIAREMSCSDLESVIIDRAREEENSRRPIERECQAFKTLRVRSQHRDQQLTCDGYLFAIGTCWLGLSLVATFSLVTVLFSIPAVHIFRLPEEIMPDEDLILFKRPTLTESGGDSISQVETIKTETQDVDTSSSKQAAQSLSTENESDQQVSTGNENDQTDNANEDSTEGKGPSEEPVKAAEIKESTV